MIGRFFLFLSVFLAMSAPVRGDVIGDARFETEKLLARGPDGSPACFPQDIAPATDVYVAAVKRGDTGAGPYNIRQFRYVDVQVEALDKPFILVLTGYDPVIWQVEVARDAPLTGVLLTGHYEQLVTGLPENTAVGQASYQKLGGERVTCYGVALEEDLRDPFIKGRHHRTSGDLIALEKALERRGGHKLVSFEYHKNGKPFLITGESAAVFSERKNQGAADLAALSEPEFPILDAGAERIAAPSELKGEDALAYLVEKGYMMRDDGRAATYFCELYDAAYRSVGAVPTRCGVTSNTDPFVILGPVYLTVNLCAGARVFIFQPSAAPEPDVRGCIEELTYLDEALCLDIDPVCWRREALRKRGR